uniref:Uncharacterized protein n=1 Tax=uncultured bacterium Contig224 TaxID=1393538 RepID=W0FMM4_9BACT|nr:hypothetical protein [uncultured bacterium Contig224]
MDKQKAQIWIARVLVTAVFAINVQCAIQFIAWPESYTYAYQLSGASAEAVVRGYGICFLMWNATYPPVIAAPHRYRVLFIVVIAQQLIGLVGESLLLASLGQAAGLGTLAASITRFIIFDGAGAVLLVIAFALTMRAARSLKEPAE